jgi:hypothetical protein
MQTKMTELNYVKKLRGNFAKFIQSNLMALPYPISRGLFFKKLEVPN